MATVRGIFEKKCKYWCGAVRIDGEWRSSLFIAPLPEVKDLPEEVCPDCARSIQARTGLDHGAVDYLTSVLME